MEKADFLCIEQKKNCILIEGAMDVETDFLSTQLQNRMERRIGAWNFLSGKLSEVPVVIVQTGIGMVNTAAATALGIQAFAPWAIVNQGIAGGYRKDRHRGDIIFGKRIVNYSAKETRGGKEYPRALDILGEEKKEFYSDQTLLEYFLAGEGKERIYRGTIASADEWNRDPARIAQLRTIFGADCEDMETAAAAQIAAIYGIAFLGVRILSNNEVTGEEYDRTMGRKLQKYLFCRIAK